jgi:RNA polymerase sigma-70 factor, ECF subfamily
VLIPGTARPPDAEPGAVSDAVSDAAPDGVEAPGERRGAVVGSDDALFAELYPALRRLAAMVAPPEAEPDDLVQEAVSRALRKGPLTRLDNPGAYLRRAVVNLAANERRRLGRWRRARIRAVRPPSDDGQPAAYPSDLADLLRLPPETRAALWLVDVEGRSFDEVAELLGTTNEAVRARASRARRALRQTITEEER